MPFTTEASTHDGLLYLKLTGDLLGDTDSNALLRLADEAIAAGTHRAVADLHEVRFLNSSGLTVLIGLLTRFRNAGGELVLAAPSRDLRKLLVITRLEAIFTLTETMEAAADQLRALAD